jgi:hypothetical protein
MNSPDQRGAPDVLRIAGVALLVPRASTAPLAIALVESEIPPLICAALDARPATFARLRRGSLAYGLLEPFAEVEDGLLRVDDDCFTVSRDTHYESRLEHSVELFGSPDTVAFLPVQESGAPFERVSIPLQSPGRPTRVLYEIHDGKPTNPAYRLIETVPDDVWICPVCGRPCVKKEPHTAAHGMPGNIFASTQNPRLLDELHGRARRIDDPHVQTSDGALSMGGPPVAH